MGADGGEQERLHLNEANHEVSMHSVQTELTVLVTSCLQLKEASAKGFLEQHVLEVVLCFLNFQIDFTTKLITKLKRLEFLTLWFT
jgi:hypothetical protein